MLKKLIKKFFGKKKSKRKNNSVIKKREKPVSIFSTDFDFVERTYTSSVDKIKKIIQKGMQPFRSTQRKGAMDSAVDLKANRSIFSNIPEIQVNWYASQSFIGYQTCSLLAQNWLISKACLMPAKDAVRNGYVLTVNDGTEVDPEILDEIRKLDVVYNVNKNLINHIQMGRIFGIRIALFKVESDDPEYYEKPFNPDGVMPYSYKGISQIDPYWITPLLDSEAAGDPSSIDFYEPTWWNISGQKIHKSHLVIFKTEEVTDILKPNYLYGGIPVPQKIYERVYAAERTANEAPMLALTKRTDVIKCDSTQVISNQAAFDNKMKEWVYRRDNYAVKTIGLSEDMQQFDTSLTDLDAVIMTQYQIVAAASNVPAVKLLGTPPKGFNSTGEFEEASYHEELESIQSHDLTPLLERHHLLLILSEIVPKYGIEYFNTSVVWNSLDAMTAKELAELNKLKADTGAVLSSIGAVDGLDERQRIVNDPESGYSGLNMDDEDLEGELEEELSDPDGA